MPVAQRLGTKLAQMDVQGLMALRKEVDRALSGHRATLEKQLATLGDNVGNGRRAGRGSAMKGRKVAAKYRSPDGETWAGRGAKPRWLVAAIKSGKKIESFLIDKASAKKRKAKG
jgi:DNA-binding protein H-NS